MKLPRSNAISIEKKHARIHFTFQDGKIDDMVAYSAPSREISRYLHTELVAMKKQYLCLGKTDSDWEEMDLSDVLLFFMESGFLDTTTFEQAMFELAKIKEFRKKILKQYKYIMPDGVLETWENEDADNQFPP